MDVVASVCTTESTECSVVAQNAVSVRRSPLAEERMQIQIASGSTVQAGGRTRNENDVGEEVTYATQL